jgi:uncharacterized protein (TIGR02611 family)
MIHFTKRVIKIGSGFVLLIAGLILALPGVPGPGLLTAFGGLAILASEFHWARRLLEYRTARFRQMRDAALRSEKKSAAAGSGTASVSTASAGDPTPPASK